MSYTLEKVFPALPKVERGTAVVFGEDPKGINLLYCNGNSVIIRNLKNIMDNDIYTQHSAAVAVAKYAPSGFYISSADSNGKVRIWDTTQKEHLLKFEYQPFAGPVKDIAWTSDSKRLFIGGRGRERFGAAILWDSGSSVGDIMGMSRPINSVDIKPTRPFKAITGSEDSIVCFFEGPPFKFKHSSSNHANFVNCVRYSPTGDIFISAGADGKLFVYDGTTAMLLGELGSPAHTGGIYGIAFAPDGKRFISASADKTLKLWAVEGTTVTEIGYYQFEAIVQNMLLGCAWVGDTIVALTLDGALHLFDAPAPGASLSEAPRVSLHGHSRPITCSVFANNTENAPRFITASYDASIAAWDLSTGLAKMFSGSEIHTSQVQDMFVDGDRLVSIGIDDRVVVSSIAGVTCCASLKLDKQPRAISGFQDGRTAVVATLEGVLVIDTPPSGPVTLLASNKLEGEPQTVAVSQVLGLIAVGVEGTALKLFSIAAGDRSLTPLPDSVGVKLTGKPTALRFSPDGLMLAVVDPDRTLTVYQVSKAGGDCLTFTAVHKECWRYHTARVTSVAWSPDQRRLATGSLDCGVLVWSLDSPRTRVHILNAHPMCPITSIDWMNNTTVLSTGYDASVKQWSV